MGSDIEKSWAKDQHPSLNVRPGHLTPSNAFECLCLCLCRCLSLSTVLNLCQVRYCEKCFNAQDHLAPQILPYLYLYLCYFSETVNLAQERARKLHGRPPHYLHTTVGTLKWHALHCLPLVPIGERRHHQSSETFRISTTDTLRWLHIDNSLPITFDSTICLQYWNLCTALQCRTGQYRAGQYRVGQ